jgi:U2 small nuclear ribonucleoprotein B''
VDVIAKKHDGGRGQAFIVFEEQVQATAALRGLSGEMFYNKALVSCLYPSNPSHVAYDRLGQEGD